MSPTLKSLEIANVSSDNFGVFWLLQNHQEICVRNFNITSEDIPDQWTPLPNIKVLKAHRITEELTIFIRQSLINVKTLVLKRVTKRAVI